MILSSKGTRMQQTSQNQHTPLSENLHRWELTDWGLFLLNTHIVMLVLRVHIINRQCKYFICGWGNLKYHQEWCSKYIFYDLWAQKHLSLSAWKGHHDSFLFFYKFFMIYCNLLISSMLSHFHEHQNVRTQTSYYCYMLTFPLTNSLRFTVSTTHILSLISLFNCRLVSMVCG